MIQLAPVQTLQRIFAENHTIAVVGLSPKINRPSNQVALYLQQAGYRIIPVNPGQAEILGEPCYPDLQSIPEPVDVVDIFRRSEHVEPVVRDAIAIGAKVVWMQQGIVNVEAATIAEQAGLSVIMDRCMKVDHRQFTRGQKPEDRGQNLEL
ncbi:MAG: CoA-binding protein [Deltaproteobacteria bacterium]|nr:CoA-binding protein [Deltaproteobacteria bacterium]